MSGSLQKFFVAQNTLKFGLGPIIWVSAVLALTHHVVCSMAQFGIDTQFPEEFLNSLSVLTCLAPLLWLNTVFFMIIISVSMYTKCNCTGGSIAQEQKDW